MKGFVKRSLIWSVPFYGIAVFAVCFSHTSTALGHLVVELFKACSAPLATAEYCRFLL